MQNTASKIVFFLLTVILVGWFSYHLFYYDTEVIATQTVFKENIPRSIGGKSVAFRNEETIQQSVSGSPRYLAEDGTRVGINQAVAEYYSGSIEDRNIQNIGLYKDEINLLEDAANKGLNNFYTADIISRDIKEQTAKLLLASTTGNCDELVNVKKNLTNLVNRREVAIDNTDNFQPRIDYLYKEIERLEGTSSISSVQNTVAPASGYFAKQCDGYETILSTDIFDEYKVEDFTNLLVEADEKPREPPQNTVGKMIPESVWYLALVVPAHEIEWVRTGQTVSLQFSHISKEIPAVVNRLFIENYNEDAVIIFSSDYISGDIVNLRFADVNVDFTEFSGLKIDISMVRFQKDEENNMVKGVYVIDNNRAKFKKISIVYEEESFILSDHEAEQQEYVKLYDQIITQGTDIYDGKVIE